MLQTFVWDGQLDGNWDSSLVIFPGPIPPASYLTNWNPDNQSTGFPVIPGAGDAVSFSSAVANTTIDLNGNRTVQEVTFGGVTDYTLNNDVLWLESGDITSNGTADHSISSIIALLAPADWTVNDTSSLTASGPVAGAWPLTKSGEGTLVLSGSSSNTNTDLTTVSDGTVTLNKSAGVNAIGGDLTLTGGTLEFGADEQIHDSATVTVDAVLFDIGTHSETISRLEIRDGGAAEVSNGVLNMSSELKVGLSGNGTLNIQAGSLVSNTNSSIADHANSTSEVTVKTQTRS